ncbi:MAG: N-acetylglutaminylglutamine synthetase [Gammaproteobacteria bacterium]
MHNMTERRYQEHFRRSKTPSLQLMDHRERAHYPMDDYKLPNDVVIDCGWGRLIFAHTFSDPKKLVQTIRSEKSDKRNIALYLRDPHVVLSLAPQALFLDPSHTYRLWFSHYLSARVHPQGFIVRKLQNQDDAVAVNRILKTHGMVPIDEDFLMEHRDSQIFTYLVAEDPSDNRIIGVITGIDHKYAFDDPENGSSLWCLAVDMQASYPGIGRALLAQLADHYATRGRAFMDLSVMHDNEQAINLYEEMGFERVPVFCVKKKNTINEKLFIGPNPDADLNPYAAIIVNEARRRGIAVDILDADEGYFQLSFGGRSVVCRESLSELTTAIAMSRCENKKVTWKMLRESRVNVPAQIFATTRTESEKFLDNYRRVVVKPLAGEQGKGVHVNIDSHKDLHKAIEDAKHYSDAVLLEEYVEGHDLRIIVINFKVVAAAVRKPAQVTGNGKDNIEDLIKKQSRRRAAATKNESRIPMDDITRHAVERSGYKMQDILPYGETIAVRDTANLHTGGTIHDVTDKISDELRLVAERSARALDIPVVGLDFIVPEVSGNDYIIIEANERPGLANHEPQPTAERFIDFLFPQTAHAN